MASRITGMMFAVLLNQGKITNGRSVRGKVSIAAPTLAFRQCETCRNNPLFLLFSLYLWLTITGVLQVEISIVGQQPYFVS